MHDDVVVVVGCALLVWMLLVAGLPSGSPRNSLTGHPHPVIPPTSSSYRISFVPLPLLLLLLLFLLLLL